jgi:hypothetical protein
MPAVDVLLTADDETLLLWAAWWHATQVDHLAPSMGALANTPREAHTRTSNARKLARRLQTLALRPIQIRVG